MLGYVQHEAKSRQNDSQIPVFNEFAAFESISIASSMQIHSTGHQIQTNEDILILFYVLGTD